MLTALCGRRADLDNMDLGDTALERHVACELGRAQERERIQAIVTHEAAHARPVTAFALALETDLSVASVIAVLDRLPPEAVPRVGLWGRR